MKTANIITLVRIALIPVFIAVYLLKIPHYMHITLAIFLLASATDKLDGYIARKYNQISNFGRFIDPLADKLLICSALILLTESGIISSVAVIIIIAREFMVTSLRIVAMSEGRVVAAGFSGKLKMVVQVAGICLLLLPLRSYVFFDGISIADTAVFVMTVVTLWSGIEYCVRNRDIIINSM